MRRIKLTQNKFALVDDEDFDRINKFRWYFSSSGYANRHPKMVNGVRRGKIMMHRVIIGAPVERFVDHINGNKLDNRKSNLRIVDSYQNIWNSKNKRKTTTGVKNVTISNHGYQVRVQRNGKRYFIGLYKDLATAIRIATKARREYHGEFTRLD